MKDAYESSLREATELWGANQGETTAWGRSAVKALIDGSLSPLQVAESVYGQLKPIDAHGRSVSPKFRQGRLTVRNLENTSRPVAGAAAARASLEAVLIIFSARDLLPIEIQSFVNGTGKLFPLRNTAREKLRATIR